MSNKIEWQKFQCIILSQQNIVQVASDTNQPFDVLMEKLDYAIAMGEYVVVWPYALDNYGFWNADIKTVPCWVVDNEEIMDYLNNPAAWRL